MVCDAHSASGIFPAIFWFCVRALISRPIMDTFYPGIRLLMCLFPDCVYNCYSHSTPTSCPEILELDNVCVVHYVVLTTC